MVAEQRSALISSKADSHLFQPPSFKIGQFLAQERFRLSSERGRRVAGFLLAMLVQLLMGLMLLTLAPHIGGNKPEEGIMIGANIAAPKPEQAEKPQETTKAKPATQPTPQPRPRPEPVVQPVPVTETPAFIEVPKNQMASLDISNLPKAAPPQVAGPLMGPPNPGVESDDTPLMEGTGPNGEPLYKAAWYREPYDDELRGYLSTARGPGWGLIACRTASGFRVEDCVKVGEYPQGSGIAQAVLAASWQFRVRPPRKGGKDLVGEWVGIRIDYGIRQQKRY